MNLHHTLVKLEDINTIKPNLWILTDIFKKTEANF